MQTFYLEVLTDEIPEVNEEYSIDLYNITTAGWCWYSSTCSHSAAGSLSLSC